MHEAVDQIVASVADKLQNYENILEVVNEKGNFIDTGEGLVNPFHELALSHGLPAICMLYGEMNEHYPDRDWDRIAHQYMQRIGRHLQEEGIHSLSMFSGAAGVALASVCVSRQGQRYGSFIANLNAIITERIDEHLEHIRGQDDISMGDYDPISGITGITAYTLLFHQDPAMYEASRKIIQCLLYVCRDKQLNSEAIPGWYISSEKQFSPRDAQRWPEGCFNIGLSHGVPSLLITLCQAHSVGINEPGQNECIRKLAQFLVEHRIESEDEIFWGSHISLQEYNSGNLTGRYTRDAWCYGSPGVAYSLLIAGKLMEEEHYILLATRAMKQAARRQKEIYCPTFCHGLSGLAYIVHRFYEETDDEEFLQLSFLLGEQVISMYREDTPFGFETLERNQEDMKQYHNVGLIDGAAGAVLALLAIYKGKKTPWDAAFLLRRC
ncbi:lanthionine synthetase C family protein [Paenibacillus pinihumi]|uniref:lanthionine synthetase C family protein n=1 Tax=Paenibacillus pinihumi TaxID=669462 RepID=UPI0003F620D9|nr:lanthionine synthetase C family protein [Paenibacillus pinihumi]